MRIGISVFIDKSPMYTCRTLTINFLVTFTIIYFATKLLPLFYCAAIAISIKLKFQIISILNN